jgi:hypothetical protein
VINVVLAEMGAMIQREKNLHNVIALWSEVVTGAAETGEDDANDDDRKCATGHVLIVLGASGGAWYESNADVMWI